jgi:uncharacterized protein YecT (DUF1311 family)
MSARPRRLRHRTTLGAALLALATQAAAASFPCHQAGTAVERRICQDPALSQLDDHLGRYYAGAREALREALPCLQADQQAWLRSTRDACVDAACLKRAYLDRLAELRPLQPGVSALREVALPRVPALVAVVPPARDTVAAPPLRNPPPLRVRGRLLNELAGGDGYVLQTPAGARHLVVPAMLLDGVGATHLDVLAREAGATFELQGHAEAAPDGSRHFAASRCIFIRRLVP